MEQKLMKNIMRFIVTASFVAIAVNVTMLLS